MALVVGHTMVEDKHSDPPIYEKSGLYLFGSNLNDGTVDGTSFIRLEGINDLVRYVNIDSETKALSYVRLLTFPLTSSLLGGKLRREAIARSQINADFAFGARRYGGALRYTSQRGQDGVLDDEDFLNAGFSKPTVVRRKDRIVVTRTVLIDTLDGLVPRQVVEEVEPDGSYWLSEMKKVEPRIPITFFILPTEM